MLKRYAFYDRPEKLHSFYAGSWNEGIPKNYPKEYNQLVDLWVKKGYHIDIAKVDVKGCPALVDPGLSEFNTIYSSTQKQKRINNLLESMTIPGLMVRIIKLAKQSKSRKPIPATMKNLSLWKSKFIDPLNEWYHPLFAKDLYKIKPEWCEYNLPDDVQKELLAQMVNNGKIPTGKDPWIVPKDHPLIKFKGTLRPLASNSFKNFGKAGLIVSMIELNLKKDIKPKQWGWFERNYPEDADRLRKKYFKVTNQKKWLEDNLTPTQQKKVDKWKSVENLLLNDTDDYTLIKNMSTDERSLVGNHLKMLDQKFSFQSDKTRDIIEPIIEKIKKQRPVLYKLYCHTTLETATGNKLAEWMRDIENKEKHKEFIEKAKTGIEYQSMTQDERYSLSSFVRKGTKYLEFKKQIEKMRPDWFDEKLRKKIIRDRHFTKKSKRLTTI